MQRRAIAISKADSIARTDHARELLAFDRGDTATCVSRFFAVETATSSSKPSAKVTAAIEPTSESRTTASRRRVRGELSSETDLDRRGR
jgi:hypothetical protein